MDVKIRCVALPLTAALLLCGCTRTPKDVLPDSVPQSTADSATAESSTPAPDSTVPADLEDAGLGVLDYDEIRAIRRDSAPYLVQMDGYYTMCRDGKWGLMRTDGTEVLACQFSGPISGCASAELQWHALNEPTMSWDTLDALTAQLQQTGDGEMCSAAHDGSFHYWYYDIDTHRVQVYSGLSHGAVQDLEDYDTQFGAYLPCRMGTFVDGQGDPDFYRATDPLTLVYANADGELLNDQTYEAAGCFCDQPLAPACQNGKWLYLDQSGTAVTEAVYDATYGDDKGAYASPLLNGYVPVCRDGQWGLLDSTGAEVVPCAYEGAAWDGGMLWLRQADGWHAYTIPGVVKPTPSPTPDPLAGMPDTITAPDRPCGDGEQSHYSTTADGNLTLRAGPGTDYDKVGTIPPSSTVECLGRSDAAENWILVCYEDQFGWACTDYMS